MNENNFMKFVRLMTVGIVLLVAGVVGFMIYFIYTFTKAGSASVGIIGGADGPTEIYLAGSVSPVYIVLSMLGAVVVIGLISFLVAKFSKKR